MNSTMEKTIGQMVADDYRTAQVFKAHKIDFCCKGNRTLSEVASKKGLDLEILMEELDQVQSKDQGDRPDVASWPLDLLVDYIEKKHHRYVEEHIPILNQYLDKLCRVHGERHPELFEIFEHFRQSSGELAMHMKKEELVLFPWIHNGDATRLRRKNFVVCIHCFNVRMFGDRPIGTINTVTTIMDGIFLA